MALWGDRDDVFSAGTVSIKLAGINTYYADGLLVEKVTGLPVTSNIASTGVIPSDLVFEVIGSATSFGFGIGATNGTPGYAATGDIMKFGTILGGTYYGSGIVVGIASTTLCYIGSTDAMATGYNDADLAGIDYTVNQQPTWGSETERWSQQTLSSEEETLAGFVGLAYSASPTITNSVGTNVGLSTNKYVLDAAYSTAFDPTGAPKVVVGDSLSTATDATNNVWEGFGNGVISAVPQSGFVQIWTAPLTHTTDVANVGVRTVGIDTTNINVGDTFSGVNTTTTVTGVGLGTIGFGHTIGLGLTAGNIVSIGRTVDNVITSVTATTIGIAQSDTVRLTRGTGADKVYITGVSTTGAGSATSTSYEVAHSGWVGVTTYFDAEGTLRIKSETLVAMSGIATGNNPVWGTVPTTS